MPTVAVLLFVALVVASCSGTGSSTAPNTVSPPAPTSSPSAPTGTTPPPTTPVAPRPTASETPFGLFRPFGGFRFRAAPARVVEEFKAAANASLGKAGTVGDARAAEAVREGEQPVTVVAFTLVSRDGTSERELLGKVADGMAAGLGGQWKPGLGGQALVIDTDTATAVLSPWGNVPGGSTVFLLATGAKGAPVEDVARRLLA